ncbi:SDR family oxidoreductase [Serratia symbiotica]|nr:type I polyketide synthase [Serratia symbiotica]MBF1994928.1 SDR family oxidoreductase [Serratia symbiotica]QTP14368.1 SDR family oxidoreductase [Serratia symbiotica]
MGNMRFSSAPILDSIDASIAQHYPDCEPIAVIGYACHFPEAPDSETFWKNLLEGRECSRRFTREELLTAGLDAAIIDDRHFVNVGTVLENADHFDATLFGYSPQEAESIDPQQRLFLQAVWHALEHAGYAPGAVPHKTGVFAASRISTYPGREAINLTEVAQVKGLQSLMGNDKDYVATRVAYKLNLQGPALSVQTACSSSLVAVHLACESLRAGESDMAVAGGVALSFPQQTGYRYQPGMIFSPDGYCRPFDASAAGTYAGNGLGCVVLRRLGDALQAGDPISAVILSSAVNNDGDRKVGYTAPSAAGQQAVIEEALALAALDHRQIGFIETHGTGTPLGDAIEIDALRKVFTPRHEDQRCALGSVKSNMGHLDTAAGIAGLLKTVLTVSHGQIPPTLHFQTPHPALKLEETPFTVPVAPQAWRDDIRYAGVSSFGIGGTNCHMIVASLPDTLRATAPCCKDPVATPALLLSAASENALRKQAECYATALKEGVAANNLAFTALHARRLDLPFRLAIPLNNQTTAALSAWASDQPGPPAYSGHGAPGKQVWLFTGQGAHWHTMGRAMYQHSAAFAQCLDRCFAACATTLTPSLQEAMFHADTTLLENMAWTQPAIVAFGVSMAAHWRAQGLEPDFAIGHSVGEFAAAVVCGHYTIEQIMPLVCQRGALMQQCSNGGMVAVFAEETMLLPMADECGLDLAATNGAQHSVFSGPEDNLETFCTALTRRDIRYHRLSITGAAHSALLEPILDAFQQACCGLHAKSGRVQLISTMTASGIDESTLNTADYWRRHMRQPVRFIQSIHLAYQQGAQIFLEVGPDAQLVASGQREYRENTYWIASARQQQDAAVSLNLALTQLYAAGVSLPWPTLLGGDGQRISAPRYPFDGARYWRESKPPQPAPIDIALSVGMSVACNNAKKLDLPRLQALKQCSTQLHAIYVDQLVRRCVGDAIDRGVDALTIMRQGRLLPRYQQLLKRLLNNCVCDGDYQLDDGHYFAAHPIDHAQRDALLEELTRYCEGFQAIPDTIARAGDHLYEMMSGAEEPVAIIFPQSASDGVEVLYQEFSFGRYFNQIAAGVLRGMIQVRPPQQPLRILEVGGGTGGTTAWLLPELLGQPALEYHFTDISALFTRRAQQKFAHYHFVHYREFDLQKDAQSLGFQSQYYDLIVAANVIHATEHVGRTLDNLRPLLKPGGRLLMREITQPMRLFDFVFGPLVLPLHDIDAREGELFLTTTQWERQCRNAGFTQIDWLPQDESSTANMSEHIILATLPGAPAVNPFACMELTSPPEPVLGQALIANGCYLADWSDCAHQQAHFAARWQEAHYLLSLRHGDTLSVAMPPSDAPAWLHQVRLSWQAEAFCGGQMIVEARHPDGDWRVLSPAITDTLLPTPETHYQWGWKALPAGREQSALSFRLSRFTLSRQNELARSGIIPDEHAAVVLLIADENDDVVALARDVVTELAASDSGLIVVTRSAWRVQKHDSLHAPHHALWALLRVAANEHPERLIAAIDLDQSSVWAMLHKGLGAVSWSQRWLALRNDSVWIPSLSHNDGYAAALPKSLFVGDPRWHLVTGAFSGLGRLAVNWLKEKGARRIALLAPRADEAWLRQVAQQCGDCQIHWFCCDVSNAHQLTAVLEDLQASGGIAGAIHAAGVLDDAPLIQLDEHRFAAVLAIKAQAAEQLLQRLRDCTGRYLICYSSAAAALGAVGQGAHALACGYMDGLAQQFASVSAPKILSIAWGAWGESGRAASPEMQAVLACRGMETLSDTEGQWHLEQAVMRGAPYRLAMRISTQHLSALQQRLFTEEDTAKPTKTEAPPATDHAFNGSLSDETAVMAWLNQRIALQLRLANACGLTPQQDLLQLGMDSLLFLELSSDIHHHLGVRINADLAWQDLSPGGLTRLICNHTTLSPARQFADVLQHNAADRYAPFPLTPIQHAYWLGRTHLIGYGGVACHVLFEWDKQHDQFDLALLEKAWNQLIARHDMLRMIVDADGQQRILPETPVYRIQRHNLRQLTPEQQQQALAARRQELSERVLPADRWPLFELVVSEIDDQHYRLHMNLDLLLFDVQSFKVMMDDLARVWRGEALPVLDITFRDYVMAEQACYQTATWHDAWDYWQEKLPHLPLAPELPIVAEPPLTPHFTTFQANIMREDWQALKQRWQHWGITPSAALLTLFAATLERWSRSPTFTLNLTFFNRRQFHPQVNQLIGDFTSVTLVDFAFTTPLTLHEQMQQTQQRLWQNMAHSDINGVEVIRELGRLHGAQRQPLMPVVFTSMLGMTLEGMTIDQAMTHLLGDPCYVFTQTPQVWLDHQVMESGGELIFSWYCMDNVLEPGVAQAMFDDYRAVLRAAIADPNSLNASQPTRRSKEGVIDNFPRRRWPFATHASCDLRDIEQAAITYPGIRQARAMLDDDGALILDIVTDDTPTTTAVAPSDVDFSRLTLPLPEQAQLDELDAAWHWLEARALQGIAATLNRHGLFTHLDTPHTFKEIVQALAAQEKHHRLIRQWLRHLTETDWLTGEGDTWRCRKNFSDITVAQQPCPDALWSQTLARYLETCLAHHDQLFNGQCSPLELLFGEAHSVANALYSENPASACLNLYAACVAALCSARKILEVGAGTAATTHHLLAATQETRQAYHFTDVSPQFLNDAKALFGDTPGLSYALFDINQPLDFSAHPAEGYDLIIAVNVLHDASHVIHTLRRLRLLLNAGGRLLVIEATERNSVLQLASVGFIEGLSGYRDFRRRDDKPMLTLCAWQAALVQAGFDNEFAWPPQEQSPLRQHLMVARSPGTCRPDKSALIHYLQQHCSNDLPTLRIRLQEALFTPIALYNPGALIAPADSEPSIMADATLEKRVADIWQSLLFSPINRYSDFFELGGDSLIATRMVAQLNQKGIAQASLHDLFTHPMLGDFCTHLHDSSLANEDLIPLCQGQGDETLFVFHASDGEVSAWLTLARHLNANVFGLQAKSPQRHASLNAMVNDYVDAIRRQQPYGPYVLLGWSYGTFLAAGAAQALYHLGEQVRVVLIDPVCQQDFSYENQSALLHLLSQGQTLIPLPDYFVQQNPVEQIASFVQLGKAAGVLPQNLTPHDANQWLDRIDYLLRLLTNHTPGEPVPVPCLIIHATDRPAHWTPAQNEWQAWMTHACEYSLDATHWQLMMEQPQVQHCAQSIRLWLADTPTQPENRV